MHHLFATAFTAGISFGLSLMAALRGVLSRGDRALRQALEPSDAKTNVGRAAVQTIVARHHQQPTPNPVACVEKAAAASIDALLARSSILDREYRRVECMDALAKAEFLLGME